MPNFRLHRFLGNVPLQWVLVVPFVMLTSGAVGLVGYLSYQSGQEAVEELATKLTTEVGDRIDQNLSHYLQTPTEINRVNSAATKIGTLNWEDFATLKQYFWQQLNIFDVTSIAVITEKKQFLVIREQDNGSRLLLSSNESTNFTLETHLTDPQGNPVKLLNRVPNFNPHGDQNSNSSYYRTRQTGNPNWQIYAVIIGKQKPTLIAANYFPFYDRANTFQGVFGVSVSLTKVSKFLESLTIGRSGEAFVIERSGYIVGTSTGEFPVLGKNSAPKSKNSIVAPGSKSHRVNALNSSSFITRITAQHLIDRFHQFGRITEAQQLTFEVQGNRYFVQVKPFGNKQNLDLLRVVVVPESDFMGKIEANTSRTILLCWLTLATAMTIGVLMARCISKPVHQLSQASQALARGDWQQALSENTSIVTPIAELKTLTHSFNQTARILQSSFDQIKNSLQESNEKFTKIFKSSPVPIAITTVDGQYLEVNDSFLTLTEYTREEIISKTKTDLNLSVDSQQDSELKKQLQAQGAVTNFEYHYQTKYGRLGTTLLSLEQIELDGQLYILTVAKDISERKQAEEALAFSEARLRAILAAIPDIIVIYSNDGIYLDAMRTNSLSDVIEDPAPIGKHLTELVSSKIAQRQLRAMQQVAKTKKPQIYEQEVWVRGKLQYEEVRIVPCGDHTVLVIIRDISVRKLHESERQIAVEALRESEERFRKAFDDAAIGMAWVDVNGYFLKVSRSLCEIVGFSEQELLKRRFQDITHPDDILVDEDLAQRMLAGDQRVYQREKRYLHRQGHIIWVLVHVSLVKDREGNPLYFVSQVQDISDRHELDRIKDEFISIVSHELRTPLTAIRGSLGILETGVLDDEPETAKQMLQVALNNSERLVRLVNDILDLERLEAGDIDLVLEDCYVDDLLQQAVGSVQAIALQSDIRIQVASLNTRIRVASDLIIQTIVNLLGNAIKFSPPGSTIWLEAEIRHEEWNSKNLETEGRRQRAEEVSSSRRGREQSVEDRSQKGGGSTQSLIHPSPLHSLMLNSASPTSNANPLNSSYALFSIKDQGRGIPPDKLKSIFGRFQQVDVSDARQKGGTGLGLAICKSIVQQHGGTIWVDSVLDQGSTFYFTLPLVRNDD